MICAHLDPKSVCSLSIVNKQLNKCISQMFIFLCDLLVMKSEGLWQYICASHYGCYILEHVTWKSQYLQLVKNKKKLNFKEFSYTNHGIHYR